MYIIMVDSPSGNIEYDRIFDHLQGISMVRAVKELNHSQFLDDTLPLGRTSNIIVKWFKDILYKFVNAMGGKAEVVEKQHIWWNTYPQFLNSIATTFLLNSTNLST